MILREERGGDIKPGVRRNGEPNFSRKTNSMIDIRKAKEIPGWMTDEELRWLATEATRHKAIVEIGSCWGRSTRALADHCSGTVYAVDDWWGPRDVDLPEHDRKNLYRRFIENMQDTRAKLRPVSANHASLAYWIFRLPDMVFIDGDHRYEYVRHDIEFWKTWTTSGGLICGHDSQYEAVDKAVREFFPEFKVADQTTIWYVTKP